MTELFDLSGKGAIVTGSSRGIGRAIAEALAAHGANVIISSRKQDVCVGVAEAINAQTGGRATAVAASVGSKDDLRRLAETGEKVLGGVDILVCNAATNPHYGPMSSITDEQFDKVLRNNVLANHWLAQFAAPGMAKRGGGAIVIVSSIGGLRGTSVIGAYNLSKAADLQLARNLAVELGPKNIRANCIAPGLIKTDFARALWEDEANLARALAGNPLGRIGAPEEIAGAAVFLASRAGQYVNGQCIVVDGGTTITAGGV
jgi:NAD(P)-dependent dehydrogenase (short-subunit alcohol dehydrogenase family)